MLKSIVNTCTTVNNLDIFNLQQVRNSTQKPPCGSANNDKIQNTDQEFPTKTQQYLK